MISTRLGPYEIEGKLGEGGMGEVYRATDSRLRRQVAIKVLPEAFVADRERLARFEREAQVLAQLQHPNIASIYGLEEDNGTRALVMELVEGEDLAARIARGPLPVDEALAVARQIAGALEEAHEKGIVHRDLKPQNVKITPEGKVKVLDFGLAKAMDPTRSGSPSDAARSPTLMNSPTLTGAGTQLGMILGTAAYMAPEQARGGLVDKRADVWAFGVVLWEMLTGRQLFACATVSDTLAAVLRADIDLDALPAGTPAAVRQLLRRCLERDAHNRLRDIGEARVALDPATAALGAPPPPAHDSSLPRRGWALRALPWVLVALLAAAYAWRVRNDAGTDVRPARPAVLALHLPGDLTIPLDDRGIYGQTAVLAIAPDGSRVAFLEGTSSKGPIYVRDLDSEDYRPLEGTVGASSPFFSPDGRWVAYFAPGKLRKIAVDGGRPIDLADTSLDRGGVWCSDGSIVYAPSAISGLMRLPADGGKPVALTVLDAARGERTHRWPAMLPDGREVAFTIGSVGQPGDYESAQIDAVDLATGRRRPLFRGASMVRFTATGLALLARGGDVFAMPLAGAHGQSAEDAPSVLRNVSGVRASGVSHFEVSREGTLVYAQGDPHAAELEMIWLTRGGEPQPLALPKGEYRIIRFSPDGTRVALAVGPGQGRGGDVWVLDLANGGLTKMTFDGHSWAPAWSRDGKSVTYAVSLPGGAEEFRRRPADGSQEAVTLYHFDDARARAPIAWMADGSLLSWEDVGSAGAGNVVYQPAGGGAQRTVASTSAMEIAPAASPDGRYVAYTVDATGLPEVYVQPFPPTGAKWLVQSGAGTALWSADGRELYVVQGREVMAVPISTAGTFRAGAPRRLFDLPPAALLADDTSRVIDVAPDGRFLTSRATSTANMNGHLVVVLNWLDKVKQAMAEKAP